MINQLQTEKARYNNFKALNLKLDMSRGKPADEQLDLSMGLLDVLTSESVLKGAVDYRNYGLIDGIPEIKAIFKEILNVNDNEIIIAGNSSLNIMYDSIQRGVQFGIMGEKPQKGKLKWLCPAPGYDRHFAITEAFGFEMVVVPMNADGPDMNVVEELVKDKSVKGMWCVPKYSNPQGIVYSDNAVRRLANLKPKAKDFRIYWDNAYMVHGLYGQDNLLDILAESKKVNNENIVYMFGSTSKITFAGGGVAFISASEKNISDIKNRMSVQTIGPDKITQLAHALYFKNARGVYNHMDKHARLIKPRFDKALAILEEEFNGLNIISWLKPRGGYFISVETQKGLAKRTVELCKEMGVIFTPAGATFPYKLDPHDTNIRVAPTFPPIAELDTAMRVFSCAAKIAYFEKNA